tara:strand:+ start:1466 stop:1840 length:375 start_codon:yes stop_codon:yes gene_type:complete
MSLSKVFNEHLIEFMDDVITILPDNLDIKTAKTFVEGLKRVNPKKLITSWYSCVTTPYKDIIENGDYTFFENKRYEGEVYTEYLKTVDNIKTSVKLLDEENKKKAMKYVQNLTKISILYNNTNN